MTADAHGRQRNVARTASSRMPAQRGDSRLVAPVTVGQPLWQRHHRNATRALDAGAVMCGPVLGLLWREAVPQAAAAALLAVLCVVAVMVAGRGLLQARLRRRRRLGRAMSTILAVGRLEDVAELVERTRRNPSLGWRVVGTCTPTGAGPGGLRTVSGVPVLGDLDSVGTEALASYVDFVAVTPTPGWTAVRLRQLVDVLDCSHTALLLDPRLVAGTGIRTTDVRGLALVRLPLPTLTGVRRLVKDVGDRLLAFVLLLAMAPLLGSCALAVRRDGGPAFERRPRLGRNGRTFAMLAFRTTSLDTGERTAAGRVLRERCLDELPQLFNVLAGSMAVVGPRPAVPGTIASQRGLLVKPGITGLRALQEHAPPSDRVDRVYLAEWSPALDARILLRTVRIAFAGATRGRRASARLLRDGAQPGLPRR